MSYHHHNDNNIAYLLSLYYEYVFLNWQKEEICICVECRRLEGSIMYNIIHNTEYSEIKEEEQEEEADERRKEA